MPPKGFKKRTNNKKNKRNKAKNKVKNDDIPRKFDFQFSESANSKPTYADSAKKSSIKTFYLRYKEATRRFQYELYGLVPKEIVENDTSVHVLEKAAEYVHDNDMFVSARLLKNLKTSIRLRTNTSEMYPMHADEGRHRYFIAILQYCWRILRPRKEIKSKLPTSENHGEEEAKVSNTFASLAAEDNEVSDDDEEDMPDITSPPVKPVKKFKVPPTIDELVNGSIRFQVHILVSSIDEMLLRVSHVYKALKMNCNGPRMNNPQSLIEDILEGAVTCNFCIKEVQRLEQELIVEVPWLNTIYRQLIILQYPNFVSQLFEQVIEVDRSTNFEEKHAIQFLGDLLECIVRNVSDPKANYNKLFQKFHKTWKVSLEKLQFYHQVLSGIVLLSVGHTKEIDLQIANSVRSLAGPSAKLPGILENFPNIGGKEYSILKTIKLLQSLSNVIVKDRTLKLKRGFFGDQWDEGENKAKKIPGDMDEFLMGDVFPALSSMCYQGIWTTKIPMLNDLLTIVKIIRDFVHNPTQSVSWGLAVGIHCILISVYEIQGNNHVHTLANTMKSAFNKYFDQLEQARENEIQGIQPPNWWTNIERLLCLKWLVVPMIPLQAELAATHEEEMRAFWNPFVGGSFLLFISFFSNLESGCFQIDAFSQLRITLHLYNALRQCELISESSIPFMDWLDKSFEKSKGVWEGDHPKLGDLVRRWWICWGASTKQAKKQAEDFRASYTKKKNPGSIDFKKTFAPRKSYREMTPILPDQISKAYRRVCKNDVSNLEDKYHTKEQQKKLSTTFSYQLAVRVNDTLDAIDFEERLLATNFTTVGVILNVFIKKLFIHLGYDKLVDKMLISASPADKKGRNASYRNTTKWEQSDDNLTRQTEVYFFAYFILGALDMHVPGNEVPDIGVKAATFMQEYFNSLKGSEYAFFSSEVYRK